MFVEFVTSAPLPSLAFRSVGTMMRAYQYPCRKRIERHWECRLFLTILTSGFETCAPETPSLNSKVSQQTVNSIERTLKRAWVQGVVAMRYNRFEVVSQSASPTSDGSE